MAERLTIIDFVEKYVAQFAKNPFLWEKNLDTNEWEPTTYEETLAKAKRIAAGLMALGVQKGEKVSYLSEGRDMWVIGELGVLYAGAVNVPLSIKLEETNDLVFRVKHSDSKYVITSKFQLPKIRKILPECPMVEKVIIFDEVADKQENEIYISEIIEMGDKFLAENYEQFVQRYTSIEPDDYANISYTSGTTADPKGILLTHRNYTANVEQAHSVIGVAENDKMLIILPLDHCFAHVAGFYTIATAFMELSDVLMGVGVVSLVGGSLSFVAGIPTTCIYKAKLNRLERRYNKSLEIGTSGNGLSMAIKF